MTRITHLEDALHADTQGVMRDQLLDQLTHTQQRLSEQLRLPQSPESFRALGQCLEACVSARGTIEVLWQRYHFSAAVEVRFQRDP
ncbi:secretion system chaperone SsaE [Pseudomonas chlororaphis]|uniref:EscE/YscE/SsaE family type III secretion system needle protein co-chaperone n=1 Tax=Pseudomonas chlororaphis TaxID=587753 RepID=UPI0039E27588